MGAPADMATEEVYFGKAKDIVGDLRSIIPPSISENRTLNGLQVSSH